jgi:hypothetical protein
MSGQLYRAVVVAMIAMGMMQPSTHEVIDVVAMGHGFVPAGRAMLVRAAGLRRALHGICGVDCDDMLINVILMQVMKMAVMEIVDMALMTDRRMPALGTVLVGMIGMMLLGAGGHSILPSLSTVRGAGVIAFRQHAPWRFPPNAEHGCRKANSRCALPRVAF